MKKFLGGFVSSLAVLVMAAMFNLFVTGCAVDEPNYSAVVAEEMMDQGDAKCECSGNKCVFGGVEECAGACTDEGCKSREEMSDFVVELASPADFASVEVVDEPVSDGTFEIVRNALEIEDFDLKQNCGGNAGPIGLSWCGNATYQGAPYDGRWSVIALIDSKGKCTMMAVKNSCDDAAEVCVLDGTYPTYGLCKLPPLCVKNADCNDQNQCTTDTCVAGMCKFTLNNGAACEDGNLCTMGDACNAFGNCVSGSPKACDDQNPCTADSCDALTGTCAYTNFPNNAVCDDGSKCIVGETCQAGKCVGTPVVCEDHNTCTADSCDALTGFCAFVPVADSTACDDGFKCTDGDACFAGKCAGQDADCNDSNPCTADSCDPATGMCVHALLPDGTECSPDNVCIVGVCTPAGIWCEAGDPPCRQVGGELGYWECVVMQGSDFGIWSELQHCGPIAQAVCVEGIGCTKPGSQEISCANGLDDDGDSLIDCLDQDCATAPACQPPVPVEILCADLLDNDGDGLADCHDPDCYANPACVVPPPPVPILTVRYAGYANPQNMEVYMYCWGAGPSGNFPMGWVPLTVSPACPAADPDYCVTISQGDIILNWYTADGSVQGCDSNLRDKVANKWIPGCDNQTCIPVYNPGVGAFITYNIVGGPSGAAMSVVDNGAGGRRFEWKK